MEGLTKERPEQQEQQDHKEGDDCDWERVYDPHRSFTPWTASQQQHTSSLQAGQSTADGASRHSSGEQPQSAQRTTNFTFVFGIDGMKSRAVLYNSGQP